MAKQRREPKPPKTVEQMRAVIASGNSISLDGEIITRVEDLPTELALAKTPEDRAAAVRRLQEQRDALDREIAAAGGGGTLGLTEGEHAEGDDVTAGEGGHADEEDGTHKAAAHRKRHK